MGRRDPQLGGETVLAFVFALQRRPNLPSNLCSLHNAEIFTFCEVALQEENEAVYNFLRSAYGSETYGKLPTCSPVANDPSGEQIRAWLQRLLKSGRVSSQAEIARLAGVGQPQISQAIAGTRVLGRKAVARLAAALGEPVSLVPHDQVRQTRMGTKAGMNEGGPHAGETTSPRLLAENARLRKDNASLAERVTQLERFIESFGISATKIARRKN